MAVRSSSGPTVGIAAAHGPAPPLRRCCTRHTVPRLHRKKLRQLLAHRPGKGWGAVAAPFNSLLHTPKPTPQAQV